MRDGARILQTDARGAAAPSPAPVDVELRGGSTVRVRPIRPQDEAGMLELLRGLDPDARHTRFFGMGDLARAARQSVTGLDGDRWGEVALAGSPERIVAHAEAVATGPGRAEVAFTVSGDLRGEGIATTLLAHLAARARERGVETLEAYVLPANRGMLRVFADAGFPVTTAREPDAIRVELTTALSAEVIERFEEREAEASAAAVARVLRPAAVAVVGGSDRPDSVGGALLEALTAGGYRGEVQAVAAGRETVRGHPALPGVEALPEGIDLALVAVPAARVPEVARGCAARGVRALAVLSSGFAEAGPGGAALQRELLEACRDGGMRLVGPNCLGVLNLAPEVRLLGAYGTAVPPAGSVGVLSQSAGLGIALLDQAEALGVGVSSFVSVGNRADLSGNDVLQYWAADPDTAVVALYLESFGNPRKFARVARDLGRRKPVIAVKSGRSRAGARASSSRTGAMVAASDATVDALFRQAGVIRAETLVELLDVARLLCGRGGPGGAPAGPRVGIVSNVGGPAILCADAAEAAGLDVAELPPAVRTALAGLAPGSGSVGNPVDLGADAPPERFAGALDVLGGSGAVDALIVISLRSRARRRPGDAEGVLRACAALPAELPVACVLMSPQDPGPDAGGAVPVFRQPESAARALAHGVRYAAWRARPRGTPPAFPDARREEAAALIADARVAGREALWPGEVAELLACHGIPVAVGADTEVGAVRLLLGVIADPLFGPVLACGPAAGRRGSAVVVRLTPVTDLDAREMVEELRGRVALPDGPGVAALEELVLRVGAMVEAHPEIQEVDLHPVVVDAAGVRLPEARVRVGPAPEAVLWPSLHAAPPPPG